MGAKNDILSSKSIKKPHRLYSRRYTKREGKSMIKKTLVVVVMSLLIFNMVSILPVQAGEETSLPPENLDIRVVQGSAFDPVILGEPAEVQVYCEDPENDMVFFYMKWDDSTEEEILGPYAPGYWHHFTHLYEEVGDYYPQFRAYDDPDGDGSPEDGSSSEWSHSVHIVVKDGRPPLIPELSVPLELDGIIETTVGQPVEFHATLHDFLDRILVAQWDFGEGIGVWKRSYHSNDTITEEYIYEEEGVYNVRMRSAERITLFGEPGNPSPWSNTIRIEVSEEEDDELGTLSLLVPSSIEAGEVFSVSVTSEGEPVSDATVSFLGEDFLSNELGIVSLTAPSVDEDATYIISASKEGYIPIYEQITITRASSTQIILQDFSDEMWSGMQTIAWSIVSDETLLNHASVVQYQMGDDIWKTLALDLDPYESYTYDTSQLPNGSPYFFRVLLLEDTDTDGVFDTYVDMDTSTTPVNIQNDAVITGWVIGTVRDTSGIPISKAKVCVILSDDDEESLKCELTTTDGQYVIEVAAGSYQVQATKTGYQSQTFSVIVSEYQGALMDFFLEETTDEVEETDTDTAVRYAVDDLIHQGRVGALVEIDTETVIERYSTMTVNVLEQSPEKITITVSDEKNATSTTLAVFISDDTFPNEDIEIKYDGAPISQMSLAQFLNQEISAEPMYVLVATSDGLWGLVFIPGFSTHTITLSSVVEALTTPLALMIYGVVAAVMVAVTVLPIVTIERKRKR